MGMRGVLIALVVVSIQALVSAQSPPFQNGTTPTETSSLGTPVTDNTFTAATVTPDSVSEAGQTVSAALKGGGDGGGDNSCHTRTIIEICTVTSTVCGRHCPGEGKTTYVRTDHENKQEQVYAN
jgi:hypothetical protein